MDPAIERLQEAAARSELLIVPEAGAYTGPVHLRVRGLRVRRLEAGELDAALADVGPGVTHVWHWRRDACDRLAMPGRVLERRGATPHMPATEVLLGDDALHAIERYRPPDNPPTGDPRWLAGVGWEAEARAAYALELLEKATRTNESDDRT